MRLPEHRAGVMVRLGTGFQEDGLMILEFRCTDFGSLKIAENAKGLALFAADLANHLDQGQLFFVCAVGKIQPDAHQRRREPIRERRAQYSRLGPSVATILARRWMGDSDRLVSAYGIRDDSRIAFNLGIG